MPKIIVVTGAESTGKSVLAASLANHFNVPLIPEIAREYVENLNRQYNYNDVEIIARKQVDKLRHFRKTERPFVFVDTWLIITKIWFEVVFREVPKWIENEIQITPIDLFLVCDIDLPWVPDLVRENGGKSREILQKKYIEQIEYYKFNYRIISGENEKRIENALNSLKFE